MKALCSNGVRAVVLELLPGFERANGAKVAIDWASTNMLMDEIKAGARGDLAILTDEAIDALIARHVIAPGTRVDLAQSAIGIAVRSGARKPDIGSAEAFKAALLAAKSITYSKTGISGVYFPTVLERLGVTAAVAPKVTMPSPGVPVGELVASGEIELAVQQISELLPVAGIDVIGPLPPELQKLTTFSAGIFAGAADAAGARALVQALTAPDARSVYVAKGMTPA